MNLYLETLFLHKVFTKGVVLSALFLPNLVNFYSF